MICGRGDDVAEFCLDCFNRLHGTDYIEKGVTLENDFCEGCYSVKPCVVLLRPPSLFDRIRRILQKDETKLHTIHHKGGKYKILRRGKLTAIERQPMDTQSAYIRVFGAAGAALDALEPLREASNIPEIHEACRILQQAIEETEEFTALF